VVKFKICEVTSQNFHKTNKRFNRAHIFAMNSILVLCLTSIALANAQLAPHVPGAAAPAYNWDSCGTKLDRLMTNKVAVVGNFSAGEKVPLSPFNQMFLTSCLFVPASGLSFNGSLRPSAYHHRICTY